MAATISRAPKFHRKQKVVAVIELPGVPVGTAGVVYYEAGLVWFRYHVAFENGRSLSNVDGGSLVTAAEWKQRQHDERVAELEAERAARQDAALASVAHRGPVGH